MKRRPMKLLSALALLLILSLCLPGCAGVTVEQASWGADYLEKSVVRLRADLEAAKATGDPAKIATAEAVLSRAEAAAAEFKASLPDTKQQDWSVARSLLTTAVSVVSPIVLQALVAR